MRKPDLRRQVQWVGDHRLPAQPIGPGKTADSVAHRTGPGAHEGQARHPGHDQPTRHAGSTARGVCLMDAHAPETEYRSSMQAAALAFLQLHRAEHLGDDEQLADRAVSYLVRALEVPLFLAPRLVELAMSELLRPDW